MRGAALGIRSAVAEPGGGGMALTEEVERRARILLVEDDETLAAGIRHNLELEGYRVEWAGDGPSGLEAARRTRPDLVILDIMLPGMDGFQVLET